MAVYLVTGIAPDPSDFITQRFSVPFVFSALLPSNARADKKATLVPSRDQIGPMLSADTAVILVKGVGAESSEFITQMLETWLGRRASLPSKRRRDANRNLWPSAG